MRLLGSFGIVLLAYLAQPGLSLAQQNAPTGTPTALSVSDDDYRINAKDVIEVYILRMPELSRDYRVNANGTIEMPFLGKIKAENKTAQEVAGTIVESLRGGYLVDPQVSVIVKQINRRFFIQGAVHNPGVFTIEGRPTLLELISTAGGLNPTYGSTAFIIRSHRNSNSEVDSTPAPVSDVATSSDSEGQPEYELRKANINKILRGEFEENVPLESGDIVHIPPADVFFVAGSVKAPGSFPLKEGTTLRQAISLAQGTSTTAAPARAVIFREETDGKKREIPVNVGAVMTGRNQDIPMMPNDIVVIPSSKTKSAFVPVINAFGINAAYTAATIIR